MADSEQYPLLRVCALLNEAGAKYLVVGGRACILHGFIRTTQDVDVLVQESEENYQRVIDGLAKMKDHYAAELKPHDFADHGVVSIGDEVQVDVSNRAWTVTYDEAIPTALETIIDGVRIPYVDLDTLIKSKLTYREKDHVDVLYLRGLKNQK